MTKNRKEYLATLPKKRITSSGLFLNERDEILLVKPTNRKWWLLPGGGVEANESPLQACIRETKEEIGLDVVPQRLLSITYKPETSYRLEGLVFIFKCGRLSSDLIAQLILPPDEIADYHFVSADQLAHHATEFLTWRIKESLTIWDGHATSYLEIA